MKSLISEVKECVYTVLQVAIEKYGTPLNKLGEVERREAEKIALRQYELQSLILSSSEACGVVISPGAVQKAISDIVARYPNEEEFNTELEANHLDQETLRYSVDRELAVEAVMDRVATQVRQISEIDARIYYYLHLAKFDQPETREASHILITVNDDYPENHRVEALKRAKTIAERLKKKPSRFAEQALKNSECPTAMSGGTLGRVKREVLFPSLDKVLFNMKAGEISTVVESPMGFHILYCEKIHPKGLVPVGQALPSILEKLNERKRKKHQKKWLSSLITN